MKKMAVLLVGAALFFGFTQTDKPQTKIENFTLTDYNGVKHSFSDYQSAKAVVVMFIATRCPVSNSYNNRMNELFKDYASRGIVFIGINSNQQEPVEEIKAHAAEHGFKFPVLKDWNNLIADRFGATVTPEIYVLNSQREVLYHGRIDNSSRVDRVTSSDVRNALEEILSAKTVSVKSTKAFGCTIKRVNG